MGKTIDKLEEIAAKLLDSLDEKPVKTILMATIVIWIIGKVIKSLK